MEHYFDQSATTKPSDEAVKAFGEAALVWGNPSSVHQLGQQAATLLRDSRSKVAKSFGMQRVTKDIVLFTSCGTESNNIAMLGCAYSKKRDTNAPGAVVISAGEHPSIENPAQRLEAQGYDVLRVPTLGGVLDLQWLENELKERKSSAKSPVIFAGFMLVNNETGAIYDVKSAGSLVKKYYPDAVVHCDAVQGYMKLKFTPYTLGVDTMTVSAHKIHAIRGAAALFVSENVLKRRHLVPVMPGGGQEQGFRSGTENLCSIASLAAAAEIGRMNLADNREKTALLRAKLDKALAELDVKQNQNLGAPNAEFLPNICSIVLPGIRSETMLNFLSGKGIYVSAGSACSAHAKKKSAALEAFGVTAEDADSTLRISLDYTNTEEDIDALVNGLREGIAVLQRKK